MNTDERGWGGGGVARPGVWRRRGVLGVGGGGLLALMGVPGWGQGVRVPRDPAGWKELTDTLAALYDDREYYRIVEMEPELRAAVLAPQSRHYLPAAYLAFGFERIGRSREALPYFEKSLSLHVKPENVRVYRGAAAGMGQSARALAFLPGLRDGYPAQAPAIDAELPRLAFFRLVEQGDERYLAGDRPGALALYRQAEAQLTKVPVDRARQEAFLAPKRRVWHEYTYYHAYDTPNGYQRAELGVRSFLRPKIRLCEERPSTTGGGPFRVAIPIVRNTDLQFKEGEKTYQETNRLEDADVARCKAAWRFAADALECYSGGQVKVETTYVDLPSVTLTGLDDRVWRKLVHVRHLDPAKLSPPQDDLFKKLVEGNDAILFVWPRGRAARAYGGGPVALPYRGGKLPVRACVKSLPDTPAGCLHELLHNLTPRLGVPGVHGPKSWEQAAREHRLADELDWYLHLIASGKGWDRVSFRTGAGAAEGPAID